MGAQAQADLERLDLGEVQGRWGQIRPRVLPAADPGVSRHRAEAPGAPVGRGARLWAPLRSRPSPAAQPGPGRSLSATSGRSSNPAAAPANPQTRDGARTCPGRGCRAPGPARPVTESEVGAGGPALARPRRSGARRTVTREGPRTPRRSTCAPRGPQDAPRVGSGTWAPPPPPRSPGVTCRRPPAPLRPGPASPSPPARHAPARPRRQPA